jgi:hypothetical protein
MNTKFSRSLMVSLLGIGLLATCGQAFAQYGRPSAQYGPPPSPAYPYASRGWEAPPQESNDFQRRGYLDGVQGAERDFQNHRIWDVNNRDEFRKPHVPWNVRGDYREGFKRGYYATVRRFEGGRH